MGETIGARRQRCKSGCECRCGCPYRGQACTRVHMHACICVGKYNAAGYSALGLMSLPMTQLIRMLRYHLATASYVVTWLSAGSRLIRQGTCMLEAVGEHAEASGSCTSWARPAGGSSPGAIACQQHRIREIQASDWTHMTLYKPVARSQEERLQHLKKGTCRMQKCTLNMITSAHAWRCRYVHTRTDLHHTHSST